MGTSDLWESVLQSLEFLFVAGCSSILVEDWIMYLVENKMDTKSYDL